MSYIRLTMEALQADSELAAFFCRCKVFPDRLNPAATFIPLAKNRPVLNTLSLYGQTFEGGMHIPHMNAEEVKWVIESYKVFHILPQEFIQVTEQALRADAYFRRFLRVVTYKPALNGANTFIDCHNIPPRLGSYGRIFENGGMLLPGITAEEITNLLELFRDTAQAA